MCCFSEHLVRECDPGRYPGGAPAHCTEVPALTLRDRGIVEVCSCSPTSPLAPCL
jgi:hypothetical protein